MVIKSVVAPNTIVRHAFLCSANFVSPILDFHYGRFISSLVTTSAASVCMIAELVTHAMTSPTLNLRVPGCHRIPAPILSLAGITPLRVT